MSPSVDAPCSFSFPVTDCNCTYSTTPAVLPAVITASVVGTKVGDDFRFFGFRGLGGTTVVQNNATNTIDLSLIHI
jgi:hypothetical protein